MNTNLKNLKQGRRRQIAGGVRSARRQMFQRRLVIDELAPEAVDLIDGDFDSFDRTEIGLQIPDAGARPILADDC
jgi:hypothetical protein